jgi:hypothetical protein
MATNAKHHLLDDLEPAVLALAQKTGIDARVEPLGARQEGGRTADAAVAIRIDDHAEQRYLVEAKRVDRAATLGHIKAQAQRWTEPALLFAPYIAPALAKQCRDLDLAFLDTAGNAYLRLPGLYIYVAGEKPADLATVAARAPTAGTTTALRVIFALLCEPQLLNAPYRDIVNAAGVALGAVGRVFADLQARGYVVGDANARNRRLLYPAKLFDEWVTNYPLKLRPKLRPRRFRAEKADWWRDADIAELEGFWGGEVAAYRLTQHLKPATYTVYMQPQPGAKNTKAALTQLVAAHRLRADPHGNIEVLDAFWNLPQAQVQPDVVPPLLAYADLVATNDARNIEAAQILRERYITDALRTA